ncbi:MAG: NUDIX hydrolase [Salinivirgaceae bacterium]|nr:MAG: NUDIX hydrolase [Salinivirgaceae bacterium]
MSEFNIRVYGLVVNENDELLLTDEYRLDMSMTKFPGGGLEKGEGTIDCLKREFLEELNQPIHNIRHFYTTDFYQKGLFYENMKLISIYYMVDLTPPLAFKVSDKPFDFDPKSENPQSFRWESIVNLKSEDLTFPIDRVVMDKLKQKFS